MSAELKKFLHEKGIATSRTTAYNPQGNGQVERLNGTLWKTIQLALKSQKFEITEWERVLDQALHSIRSLLCTSTNVTPHERMFLHNRMSSNGCSLPSWLMKPGPVLMKKHVRESKYLPLVEQVELLEANPHYSFVRLANGREETVSNRHLAPANINEGEEENEDDDDTQVIRNEDNENTPYRPVDNSNPEANAPVEDRERRPPSDPEANLSVEDRERRPQRSRRPPAYLKDYACACACSFGGGECRGFHRYE